jgi:hypothetical protein
MKRSKKKGTDVSPFWTPFQEFPLPPDAPQKLGAERLFKNSRYHVFLRMIPHPGLAEGELMTHLSIKRNDRRVLHDWRDLQRIKNEICDPECEAIEIYPAESRLVDTSNQYHLWVFPKGKFIPFGFFTRIVSEAEFDKAKQRPFDQKPEDLLSTEDLNEKLRAATT